MKVFALSVKSNDFTPLYNSTAKYWQAQITADKLKDIFKVFIDKKIDLAPLIQGTPVLSKTPVINNDDILVLEGYYTNKPYIVNYTLKYLYEYPEWKLIGINVKM